MIIIWSVKHLKVFELMPKLIRASFDYDRKTIESISLLILKKIKKDYPEIATEIAKSLTYAGYEGAVARSINMQPLPVDRETRFSLIRLEEPMELDEPILDNFTRQQLDDFINERKMLNLFIDEGITPPNSILLNGDPGVGKTYTAKWISYVTNIPLVTLDLASSISSYLGRSGQNLRNIFDYVKSQNTILFLDELDAIAKRRDDVSDLGELKRIVNVLLKELESCPINCIIIGATNHPELLDKAIWRRFDRILNISMPGEPERERLLIRHLEKFLINISKETLKYLIKNSQHVNAADICKLCEHIKRQFLLFPDMSKDLIALQELFKVVDFSSKEDKVSLCKKLRQNFPELAMREISQITRISLSTVSRYLSKTKEEAK